MRKKRRQPLSTDAAAQRTALHGLDSKHGFLVSATQNDNDQYQDPEEIRIIAH